MEKFFNIRAMAEKRKGGEEALLELLPPVLDKETLAQKGDDRFLAMMCRAINQAGFNWTVISNKWPQFEEAFYGFNINKLANLTLEEWEAYAKDTRVVRNWTKIKAVMDNTAFIQQEAKTHGSFAKFIAYWPPEDQVGLLTYLKKHGSRLGGNTGHWFLRYVGRDTYILTQDVVLALQEAGVDISDNPTSKKELLLAQDAFNHYHNETNIPYSHIGRILACSVGINYDNEGMKTEIAKMTVSL